MISIIYTDEFIKEYKSFLKKYKSLGGIDDNEGDFSDLKKIILYNPKDNMAVERINQLGKDIILPVYKVRKFYCSDLKSSGKLRLVYIYDENSDKIQFVQFLEFYAKADKKNEDKKRIEKYAINKKHI